MRGRETDGDSAALKLPHQLFRG